MKTISDVWHESNEKGKIKLLEMALEKNVPFHEDLLRDTIENIDRLAKPLGFEPVSIIVVDMAGMRDRSFGVVSPEIAFAHRKRSWTC